MTINKLFIPVALLSLSLTLLVLYIYGKSIRNFSGFPKQPDSLYEVKFNGHQERLEQALLSLYQSENLDVKYLYDDKEELHLLRIKDQEDSLIFVYTIRYCKSMRHWLVDDYHNCDQSVFLLYRVYKNAKNIYDYRKDKNSYSGIEPYIEVLNHVLIEKVNQSINSYPMYQWVKEFNLDSSEALVHIIKESTSDTIAEYKFKKMSDVPNNFRQVYAEKHYYRDTTIRYEFDITGYYRARKYFVTAGRKLEQDY